MTKLEIFGIAALIGAALCYVAETTFYNGADANGVLQESFFLPLTFILGALGIVMLVASLFAPKRG